MRVLWLGLVLVMTLLCSIAWGAQGYLFLDEPVQCFVTAEPDEEQTIELPEFMTETVEGRTIKRWPNLQADALKLKENAGVAVWYIVTVGDYLEEARSLPQFLADSYTGILYHAMQGTAPYVTIARQIFSVEYVEDDENKHMNLGDWITAGKPGVLMGIRVPLRVFGIAAERGVEVE